jgi:ketosteroid isomerase-like protein
MSEALDLVLTQIFTGRRLDPELLTEDAEWVNPHNAVEPGTRRGADEFNKAIASVFATWDDVHFDTDQVIDNGDQVVALGSLHGHLNASGMVVSAEHGQIWTFRDGRVLRMQWFNTHRETLEAAGSAE